jgi:hypothetical protein
MGAGIMDADAKVVDSELTDQNIDSLYRIC